METEELLHTMRSFLNMFDDVHIICVVVQCCLENECFQSCTFYLLQINRVDQSSLVLRLDFV